MEEARVQFSKNMILFCKSQVMLWQSIYQREKESLSLDYPEDIDFNAPIFQQPAQPLNPVEFPQVRPPHRHIRDRDLRARIVHVLGVVAVILIAKLKGFMLGFACIYCVLVIFGLPLPGQRERPGPARANLETSLGRLRMQGIARDRVRTLEGKIEELTEMEKDQLLKDLEFLRTCQPRRSWFARAFYQLFVLFLLTLLPSFSPDPELMK